MQNLEDEGLIVMSIQHIREAIIIGDNENAVAIAKMLIKGGTKPKEIIISGVTEAMAYLDRKCTIEEFCLLELMLAGRAAMDVIDYLYAEGTTNDETLSDTAPLLGKKIVLGTIKGDMHEIGKNIFSMVMRSHGHQVVDMGKNVDPHDLVLRAFEDKADYIAVSSLITSTVFHVAEIRKIAMDKRLHTVKIIAGGAALQQSDAEYLNVDFVANTAFDGLRYIETSES
jgi:methanogenic corrinoid protein MtbC1